MQSYMRSDNNKSVSFPFGALHASLHPPLPLLIDTCIRLAGGARLAKSDKREARPECDRKRSVIISPTQNRADRRGREGRDARRGRAYALRDRQMTI